MCVYIYIERERDVYTYMYIYIYTYVYYNYDRYRIPRRRGLRGAECDGRKTIRHIFATVK